MDSWNDSMDQDIWAQLIDMSSWQSPLWHDYARLCDLDMDKEKGLIDLAQTYSDWGAACFGDVFQ